MAVPETRQHPIYLIIGTAKTVRQAIPLLVVAVSERSGIDSDKYEDIVSQSNDRPITQDRLGDSQRGAGLRKL